MTAPKGSKKLKNKALDADFPDRQRLRSLSKSGSGAACGSFEDNPDNAILGR
jgi:hypothetical protein